MNSPATSRIALAAILIFSASIAIGAEKKPVPTLDELKLALNDKTTDLPALLSKLKTFYPFKPEDVDTLRFLKVSVHFKLGVSEYTAGNYEKATVHLRSAAALCKKQSDPDAWEKVRFFLVSCLTRQGLPDDDLLLAKQVLADRERTLGPEDPDTLLSANELGDFYSSIGDSATAEPLYRRAMEGLERKLGRDHPATLTSVHNLALASLIKGDNATAETLFLRALDGRERTIGFRHPATVATMGALVNLYSLANKPASAEPLLHRLLDSQARSLGPEHLDTLRTTSSLGITYIEKGDLTTAEPLLQRALKAQETKLGLEDPDTCFTAYNLATLFQKQEQFAKASLLAEQALKGFTKTLGVGHEYTSAAKKLVDELKKTK